MTYGVKHQVKVKDSYLLPEITDKDLDSYKQKADDYENETKKYQITPMQRLELAHQLRDLGIVNNSYSGTTGLINGLRVNKGKTNYDIYYDEGKDSYVVYKLTRKGFTDFEKEKFDDVYVEDLKEIIK
jgi:hypothetical protein